MKKEVNRVAILGCRNVLAIDAYSLATSQSVDEVVLLGKGNRTLSRQVRQIIAERHTAAPARVFAGNFAHAADAKIAVIAAGDHSRGEVRDNAEAIRSGVRKIVDAGFSGILLVTTNPIEVMAHVARDESAFPAHRVVGLPTRGSDADDARPVATWCSASDVDITFVDDCDPTCHYFTSVAAGTRRPHAEMNTLAGIATCVKRVCEPMLRREPSILPLSALTRGEYDVNDVYLSVPCLVDGDGVERVIERPTAESESIYLHARAKQVRAMKQQLEQGAAAKVAAATGGNNETPQ